MGSDYTLNVICKILPEHRDFIAKDYLRNYDNDFYSKRSAFIPTALPIEFAFFLAEEIIDLRKSDPNSEELVALLKEVNDAASKEIVEEGEEEYNKKKQAKKILEFISLPKFYRDLIEIWIKLDINRFHIYKLKDDNTFTCLIQKRCNRHEGDLRDDMEAFVKDILVPITSEISSCTITVDDYDIRTHYTDLELRGGGRLNLREIIKSITHIYDGDDIVETRVVYKRSIKSLQKIDLDRCYERY